MPLFTGYGIFSDNDWSGDPSIGDEISGTSYTTTVDTDNDTIVGIASINYFPAGGVETGTFYDIGGGNYYFVPDNTGNYPIANVGTITSYTAGAPACLGAGTTISTPSGDRPVDDLVLGDLVNTLDHGPRPLRWIGRRRVSFRNPYLSEHARPHIIKANSLGAGQSARDLTVSPQHRIMLSGSSVMAACGAAEVLVKAKWLDGLRGIRRKRGARSCVYYALLFDAHEIVFAHGLPVESFRPGPTILKAFPSSERAEVEAVYPGLTKYGEASLGPPARPILDRPDVKKLLQSSRKLLFGAT